MIFGTGMNKTGTKSPAGEHGIKEFQRIHEFEFVNEFWGYTFPNSKFIMLIKDIDSWLKPVLILDIPFLHKHKTTYEPEEK